MRNLKRNIILYKHAVQDGGYTSPDNKGRYLVGISNVGEVNSNDFDSFCKLVDKVKDHKYLGLWIDEGVIYVNLVHGYDNRQTAFERAHANNEKAIYDRVEEVS